MDDMILITPDDRPDGLADTIASVQQQLTDMRAELDHLYNRIQAGELNEISNAAKTISDIRQWLKIAIDVEVQLEKREKEKQGIIHDFAIDLSEARSEIGGKLDSIRDARGQ
ncbi:MAG: hypothetical protein AAFZ04_14925 [Pseudomonadota bacterium]